MFERFTKLFSKKHEEEIQIGSPDDLRTGDMNPNTRHDVLPKFQAEGLISRETARAKLSKEDQTEVRPPWQRPARGNAPIRFDFGAPISLKEAEAEFSTVAEAQVVLKDATQHSDQNGPLNANNVKPTVTQPAANEPGDNVNQTSGRPVKPPQWVPAKPKVEATSNEILKQNHDESTPRLASNPNRELGRTHSSKQL